MRRSIFSCFVSRSVRQKAAILPSKIAITHINIIEKWFLCNRALTLYQGY